jgi:Cu/Ag efflux protein CusF
MEHSIDRSEAPSARHWRVAVSALALVAAGCRSGDAPSPAAGPAARRYDVRAEVVALPRPQAKPPQLTLRHEAIPGFVDGSGAVVGMSSMVMAFDLAPSASAEGLNPGDKVEVRLAVDWSRPSLQIERLRKLPAETSLRFDAASADGG